MNYEGEKLLLKLYRELYNENEEKHLETKRDNMYELVNKQKKILENFEREIGKNHETLEKDIKERYYDKYVIKEEDIPESYYEHTQYTPEMKHKEAQRIIEKQKRSLDKWLDYLMIENTTFPMWARYWALQGMLKLGVFDKTQNTFTRRKKGTTEPFVELNPEALSYAVEIVNLYQNGKEIDDEELAILVKSENFGKIYSHNLWKIANDEPKKDKTNALDGIWVHYENGDAIWLVKAISGKETYWEMRIEETAKSYLAQGTIDIYFTKDDEGKYTNPRAYIRTKRRNLAEVGGIAEDCNIEFEMIDIVEQKLYEFPDKAKFNQKINTLKEVYKIYNKVNNGEELSEEEMLFIYQREIEGFSSISPIINEIHSKTVIKDKKIALKAVKQNGYYLKNVCPELQNDKEVVLEALNEDDLGAFEYASPELRDNKEIVLEAVKLFGGNLEFASKKLQSDKEVVLEAIKEWGGAIRYASPEFQNDKLIALKAVKQDGWSLEGVSSKLQNDKEVVLAAVKQNVEAFQYAGSELRNDKEFVLGIVEQNVDILEYVGPELQNDDFFIKATFRNGMALKYLDEYSQNTYVVRRAIQQNGLALQYALPEYQNAKWYVMWAVKQNSDALQYASYGLQNDPDILEIIEKKEKETTDYIK